MELFKLFGTIAIQNADANEAIDDTTDKASQSENKISSAFKKIGTAVATYFAVDKIIEFGKSITEAAATVAAEQSAFEQIMGEYSNTAQEKINEIADTTGMVSTRLTPYMTSMTAKFKGLGFDIGDATDLAQDGLTLAADAAAFWDKSLEDSMSGLNSFINGSYEGGEAIGLFANDTQLASYAVREGIVSETKEWANLDEARKQATRLQYAQDMMALSGATGQASKEADQYANVQANLTEKWRQFKAQIGEPLLQNVVLPAMQRLSDLVDLASDKFPVLQQAVTRVGGYLSSTFSPALSSLQRLFGTVRNAVQPLTDGITSFFTSTDSATSATGLLNTAMQGLSTGVSAVANVLSSFVQWVSGGSAGAQGFRTSVIALTAAYVAFRTVLAVQSAWTGLIGMIGKARTAFTALSATLMANPIAVVIAAVAALAAGFIYLWNTSDGFRNFFIGLWDGIVSVASNAWNFIKTAADTVIQGLTSGWQAFTGFFANLWTGIANTLSTVWETIKNVISVALQFIVELFTAYIQIITMPWMFIWTNCKDYLIAAWELIKSAVSTAINAVKTTIETVFNAVAQFINTVWTGIRTAISTIANAILSVITAIWNAIQSTTSTVFNAIRTVATTVWNAIKTVITNVVNGIKNTVTSVWNGIRSTTSSVFNGIRSVASSVWNGIRSTISSVANGIRSTVSSVWNGIRSTTSSVFNGVRSTASSVWNGIKSAITSPINAARDAVGNAINRMKSFFNFSWSLPRIKLPHFRISGKFSLNPPSIPHFSVSWYKKAMDEPYMFTKPTLFDVNPATGTAKGAGEAGDEVMIGKDTMLNMIRQAVAMEQSGDLHMLVELMSELLTWLNNGGLTEVLIDVLLHHVKLEWEGRELARLVRTYA